MSVRVMGVVDIVQVKWRKWELNNRKKYEHFRGKIAEVEVNGGRLHELCPDQADQPDSAVLERERERGVLPFLVLATIDNDHETLERILKKSKIEEDSEEAQQLIRYACLKNYKKCISVLYRHGCRVKLHKEDRNNIPKLFEDKKYDQYELYDILYSLCFPGKKNISQFSFVMEKIKTHTKCCKDQEKEKGDLEEGSNKPTGGHETSATDLKETDLTRLEAMKAYTNHHYIITEFLHENEKEEESPKKEDSRHFDPMRKTLILARYCKFLSMFCVQYSREYLEISKVSKAVLEGRQNVSISYIFHSRASRSWQPPSSRTVTPCKTFR